MGVVTWKLEQVAFGNQAVIQLNLKAIFQTLLIVIEQVNEFMYLFTISILFPLSSLILIAFSYIKLNQVVLMTYMDIVDMVAPNIKNTVVTLTQVIGIGNLELLVKVPVAVMRLHTAPKSHVQVRTDKKQPLGHIIVSVKNNTFDILSYIQDVSMNILVMIWLQ